MAIVPDVSAILALALDDEVADFGDAVLDAITADEAVVPTLFWFEIRNALFMAERRRRLTAKRTAAFLADLALLPMQVDDQVREGAVLDLARRHALTVYDATYLELAQRKRAPLATLNRDLVKAATQAGVALFKPPHA